MALLSVIRRWHFCQHVPIREFERRTASLPQSAQPDSGRPSGDFRAPERSVRQPLSTGAQKTAARRPPEGGSKQPLNPS
jgi:hypothetical protein